MIITRTAFRIPLAGGGTDLDFYYKKNGGDLISSTFNQYVFVLLAERPIDDKILIQTTTTQFANNINKVRVDYLKKIGIPENVISNELLPNNYIKILNDSIIKLF